MADEQEKDLSQTPDAPLPGEGGFERRQPVLNVPGVILVSIVILVAVHVYRTQILSFAEGTEFLFYYAFFPARFDAEIMRQAGAAFPGGAFGAWFSFVSYSLLHADWVHLCVNSLWLLIFGSALARRFGVLRFLMISVAGSVAGALLHLVTNFGSFSPMVGASAAISAHMACAARFAFVPYGPLGRPRSDHPGAFFLPALSVMGMIRNRQVASFLGIWFIVNLLFGLGSGVVDGEASVAWQAHIGGFLAGLVLFPFFDPTGTQDR